MLKMYFFFITVGKLNLERFLEQNPELVVLCLFLHGELCVGGKGCVHRTEACREMPDLTSLLDVGC